MTIECNKANIYTVGEGSDIEYIIEYAPKSANVTVLSSTLPYGVSTSIITQDDKGIIKVFGTLPHVEKDTSYYASFRLTDGDERCDSYIKIDSKNLVITWNEAQKNEFEVYTSSIVSEQLKLNNSNGNEIFKITSGTLPRGLTLTEHGIISGSVDVFVEEDKEFNFSVDVFVDGDRIYGHGIEKQFKITVSKSSENAKPYWVTETGVIGNINYNEKSKLNVLAINSSQEGNIIYFIKRGSLPPGILFNNQTGNFYGTLTSQQFKEYELEIVATNMSTKVESEQRKFIIKTNDLSKEHRIVWQEEGTMYIGEYSIGSNIVGNIQMPTVEDGSKVAVKLNVGNIPKGLKLSSNGVLSGKLESQDAGLYTFTIMAETPFVSSEKTVEMRLKQGLGENAIQVYFRINNEYRDEYIEIKNQLNPNTLYKTSDENFKVDTFPIVNIATLTCFDRELLSNLMWFGNESILRFGKTTSSEYVQVNDEGETVEHYEVIYKPIDESSYQWEEHDYGSYDYEGRLEYLKSIGEMDEDAVVDFNKMQYELEYESDTNKNGIVDEAEKKTIKYNIFNFYNFRKLLTQKIYVYQKNGTYLYSVGSQELIDMSEVKDRYNLYSVPSIDIESGEEIAIYKITKSDTISNDDIVIKYKDGIIFDRVDDEIENVLFTKCNISGSNLIKTNDTFMYRNGHDTPYYVKDITNPYCYDRNSSKNTITLNNFPENAEMVLPYITSKDVINDEYIVFLDENVEQLPEWKRDQVEYWKPNTQYKVDDVLIYDGIYYRCIQEFKSGSHFIFDANLYEVLTNSQLQQRLKKKYFPTLDLGYFEPNTNRYYISLLNDSEDDGEYWNGRDFYMYEITCSPVFNKNIEQFVVQLNPKMSKSSESYIDTTGFEYQMTNSNKAIILTECNSTGYVSIPNIRYREVLDE